MGLLGPLARRDFAHLVAIVFCFATAFGLLEIGITAYAIQRPTPRLTCAARAPIRPGTGSMLVTKSAAAEHSTEAFTWTTSALLAGVGAGVLPSVGCCSSACLGG
jgi:hypothetical protein